MEVHLKLRNAKSASFLSFAFFFSSPFCQQWQSVKLRPVLGGSRPPLGPGQVAPNHARNVALKRWRRERQSAVSSIMYQGRDDGLHVGGLMIGKGCCMSTSKPSAR